MNRKFEGKTAFITGGGSGLGEAIAKDFALQGANVVIFDISVENGKRIEEEIQSKGGHALFTEGDVKNSKSVEECVAKAFDKFGTVDFLINSAGILRDGLIHKLSEEKWDLVMNINLKGSFLCLKECSKRWIEAVKNNRKEHIVDYPDKRVINISSIASEGSIGQINYVASKAGIIGLTKTAAMELIRYNIRTHAIMPTLIETPILGDVLEKEDGKWRKYYEGRIPLGIGKPRYVSDAIQFLCSEDSWFMNGVILPINGGRLGPL
ncbi:MAG: SDR family oxidoreductase [Candidatus Lokiarchaeota archaeon]|nr:SDR family oxidoreductase [Candidatus Lokiarchaeota archaeon]